MGSVNQGQIKVGDVFSAHEQNTIFLTDVCSANSYLDGPMRYPEERSFLKNIGSLTLRIANVIFLDDVRRVAELKMEEDSAKKYEAAISYLLKDNFAGYRNQNPPLMTMTPRTVLRVGDALSLSYLSVMEPLGEGSYKFKHDYPIQRTQGPRFEFYGEL